MTHESGNDFSALFSALAEAKKAMDPIIRSKRGGQAKYVPLESMIETVDKALGDQELFQIQPIQAFADGTGYVETRICHIPTGLCITGQYPIPPVEASRVMNLHQAMGSAITYARRYSLQSVLGISPEDDDDAKGAGSTHQQEAPRQQPQRAQGAPTLRNSKEEWDKKIRTTPEVGFQQLGVEAAKAFKEEGAPMAWMMHGLISMAPTPRVLEYLHGLCAKIDMTGDWSNLIGERSNQLQSQAADDGGTFS